MILNFDIRNGWPVTGKLFDEMRSCRKHIAQVLPVEFPLQNN